MLQQRGSFRTGVVVPGETSDWLTVTAGVPQVSILGLLFFLIYINDLPGVVSEGNKIALYADDSKQGYTLCS